MGGEIRKLFGMFPPWSSCFTCYMGVLRKGQIDVLQKSSSLDVLNAIERLQSKGVSPSVESVVQALMRPRVTRGAHRAASNRHASPFAAPSRQDKATPDCRCAKQSFAVLVGVPR